MSKPFISLTKKNSDYIKECDPSDQKNRKVNRSASLRLGLELGEYHGKLAMICGAGLSRSNQVTKKIMIPSLFGDRVLEARCHDTTMVWESNGNAWVSDVVLAVRESGDFDRQIEVVLVEE